MTTDPDLARLAALVTEPARAAMLQHLLDGRSWTAKELSRVAGVRPSAASAHLKKLVQGGLLKVSPTGRHRYFRLATPRVATLIEQLQCFAPVEPAATPGQRRAMASLRTCRLCYDHLAGRVGVALTESMLRKSWLVEQEPWFHLTERGIKELSAHGVEPLLGRTCMDWSERRLHVAGPLGAQLLCYLLQRKAVVRDSKSRALRITPGGWDVLQTIFGISIAGIAEARLSN